MFWGAPTLTRATTRERPNKYPAWEWKQQLRHTGSDGGRLRAEEPEIEVRVNPPGPGISDMISLVAAPLLEAAPDCAAKRSILMLAATAWNYALLSPVAQKKPWPILRNSFRSRGDGDFCLLRRPPLDLFPDARRLICKLETDPAPEGDLEVRVVSAM